MADEPKKSSWMRLPIAFLIGLGLGLGTGGAGAGYVWWNGQQDLAAAQTEIEDVKAASERALQEHTKALDAELQKGVDLSVRIEVARAIAELDRQNFGTAEDHVQAAQGALDKASSDVQEAAKNLGNIKIDADTAGGARDTLVALAKSLDAALK